MEWSESKVHLSLCNEWVCVCQILISDNRKNTEVWNLGKFLWRGEIQEGTGTLPSPA